MLVLLAKKHQFKLEYLCEIIFMSDISKFSFTLKLKSF